MALELRVMLKECVGIPSMVWAYMADQSLGEKSHWATMAKKLNPSSLSWNHDSL